MDFKNKLTPHSAKALVLSVFFVLYLVALWFNLSAKGICVDGHFYRKSASMTTITYTCRSPFADYRNIVMHKQMDSTIITIDDAYRLTVNSSGGVSVDGDMSITQNLPDARWDLVASQKAETSRGGANKHIYIAVFAVYTLFFLSRHYNTKIYDFFHRNRVAGENYYRIFDKIFTIATIAVLIYFILPL